MIRTKLNQFLISICQFCTHRQIIGTDGHTKHGHLGNDTALAGTQVIKHIRKQTDTQKNWKTLWKTVFFQCLSKSGRLLLLLPRLLPLGLSSPPLRLLLLTVTLQLRALYMTMLFCRAYEMLTYLFLFYVQGNFRPRGSRDVTPM